MRCEDFPCCGHEMGCCPDYDESGKQLNMKCTCGATIPIDSPWSICEGCMHDPDCPGCRKCDQPTSAEDGCEYCDGDGCEECDEDEPYEPDGFEAFDSEESYYGD